MKKVVLLFSILFITMTSFAQGYQVGDKAADFKLRNVDGKYYSMADFPDAKGFVVIFSCNHCPYVVAYEDRMIELHKEFAPKGFPVIAINPNDSVLQPQDSFVNMQKRAKEKNFPFLYLHDAEQKVFPKYGATRTPHVFLLKRDGRDLKVAYIGAIDDNHQDVAKVENKYLSNAINAVISGRNPDPNFTRAIGCTIKAK
jgi:peroxiredoxin